MGELLLCIDVFFFFFSSVEDIPVERKKTFLSVDHASKGPRHVITLLQGEIKKSVTLELLPLTV